MKSTILETKMEIGNPFDDDKLGFAFNEQMNVIGKYEL